jgi:hypothetical protein
VCIRVQYFVFYRVWGNLNENPEICALVGSYAAYSGNFTEVLGQPVGLIGKAQTLLFQVQKVGEPE